MKTILKLLAKRWRSKSPKLFKYIGWGALVVGTAAMVIPSLPVSLPIIVAGALPLISSGCAGIVSVAFLTTSDEKISKETDNAISEVKNKIKNINKK
jgi:hypothetical protein